MRRSHALTEKCQSSETSLDIFDLDDQNFSVLKAVPELGSWEDKGKC